MSAIGTFALLLAIAPLVVLAQNGTILHHLGDLLTIHHLAPATNLLGDDGVDVGLPLGTAIVTPPDPPVGSLPTGGIQ